MACISSKIKKPSVTSAIPQKSMGPEPVSSFFLPADNAPYNQMASPLEEKPVAILTAEQASSSVERAQCQFQEPE